VRAATVSWTRRDSTPAAASASCTRCAEAGSARSESSEPESIDRERSAGLRLRR
jgi:hypothetical protein